MQANDIRVFIHSRDFQESRGFYQALGFTVCDTSDPDLAICELGKCGFFLQNAFNETFASHLSLQLMVTDIEAAYERISGLEGYNCRYQPIQDVPWGRVIYLWGPAGELWHVTQLNVEPTSNQDSDE